MDVSELGLEMSVSNDTNISWAMRSYTWFIATFLVSFFGIYFSFCWFVWPYSGYIAFAIMLADLWRQKFALRKQIFSAEELFPDHNPKPEKLPLFGKVRFASDITVTFSVLIPLLYLWLAEVLERHNLGCIPSRSTGIFRAHIAAAKGCTFYFPAFILNSIVLAFSIICIFINLLKLNFLFARLQKLWFLADRKLDSQFLSQLICILPIFLSVYIFYFTQSGPGIPTYQNFGVISYLYLVGGIGLNVIFLAVMPMAINTSILLRLCLKEKNYKFYRTQVSIIQQWSNERAER